MLRSRQWLFVVVYLMVIGLTALEGVRAITRSSTNIRLLKTASDIWSFPFDVSGRWCVIQPLDQILPEAIETVADGLITLLNCPIAAQKVSSVTDWADLTDIQVFWDGYAFWQNKQSENAIEIWRHRPYIAKLLVHMAYLNFDSADQVEELTALATEIWPDNLDMWYARGDLLQYSHPELAVEAYTHLMLSDPHNYVGYLYLGLMHLKMGSYAEALASCTQASQYEIPITRDKQRAWACVGEAAFQQREWPTALHAFETALVLKPNDPLYEFWIGRVYYATNDTAMAIESFYRAISAATKIQGQGIILARSWYQLGIIYQGQAQSQEAILAFTQVLIACAECNVAQDAALRLTNLGR